MTPTQIVVLGMHRSGTSGVTRLLNLSGAYFGPPEIATEPNEENPRGFWERRDVRAVCDGLLQGSGHDWWKLLGFSPDQVPDLVRERARVAFDEILAELDQHQPWVIKEPRLCVLAPLLLPQLETPVFVHVSRDPLEVARSMHARDGFSISGALALWERYTLQAFTASQGHPRVLVHHHEVLADPVAATAALVSDLQVLGVAGLTPPDDAAVLSFISAGLHRHRSDRRERPLFMNQPQVELAAAVDDGSILATVPAESAGALAALEQLEGQHQLVVDLSERDAHIRQRDRDVQRIEREREELALYRDTEVARRRELGRQADAALRSIGALVERFDGSTVGRLARRSVALRQTLTPGTARTTAGPLDATLAEVARRRGDLAALTHQEPAPGGTSDVLFATNDSLVRRTRPNSGRINSDRPSVAVLAWDVGHNPLGRANVLAEVLSRHFDVELWGAQFERYGSQIWAPLRSADTPINVFPGGEFPEYRTTVSNVAGFIDADALWVSKPRLPSYLLGIDAKMTRNRPLVLDVDDHELAFFGQDSGLSLEELRRVDPAELVLPFERAWTQACDEFIGDADQVTVSNVALQDRYGGLIVPHARNEVYFDPDRYDRDKVRHRLGVAADERLLLFGGTPRVHKGVVEVLAALDRLGDDRYRVLIFGTREFDELRPAIGSLAKWARVLPAQSFGDLPELVAAADLACVVSDPAHPVTRYQMPAKVFDAMAMAIPCLVTPTPPLAPLIEADLLEVLQPTDQLHERIARVFEELPVAQERAQRARAWFLTNASYAAVAERIVPVFERLIEDPPPVSPRLVELAATPQRVVPVLHEARPVPVERTPRRSDPDAPAIAVGSTFDVVVFWKQNDSGIYGRRQDMFVQELARSPRVGNIIHFDNPITPEELWKNYRAGGDGGPDQRRLVATETVARARHRRSADGVSRHTYLFGGRFSRRLGWPKRQSYVDHVAATLKREGIGGRPLLVWVYPSNDDLPRLIDSLAPALVVADVVDDNRTWYEPGAPHAVRIEENYRAVLARSDVVVANCQPVAESMASFAPRVDVVANGCEAPDLTAAHPRPESLQAMSGPVIAYVGNLSSRLDVGLIEAVARAHSDWNVVLVGSAHLDGSALALGEIDNVHLLGVMPYRQVRDLLAHVDVGIIPHVDNAMTRSMNPLKAYVYVSAGLPVVSTPVANLPDFGDQITVAADPESFIAAIEAHLAAGRRPVEPEVLVPHLWSTRLDQVFALVDEVLGGN